MEGGEGNSDKATNKLHPDTNPSSAQAENPTTDTPQGENSPEAADKPAEGNKEEYSEFKTPGFDPTSEADSLKERENLTRTAKFMGIHDTLTKKSEGPINSVYIEPSSSDLTKFPTERETVEIANRKRKGGESENNTESAKTGSEIQAKPTPDPFVMTEH